MSDLLNFIFPNGNYEILSLEGLVCLFVFSMLLECISSIIGVLMKNVR